MNFYLINHLKKLLFFVILLFVFLCAIYSLGIFDNCFTKSVSDQNYGQSGFTYTGNILESRFTGEGKIDLDDGSKYKGTLKRGKFDGEFTYINKNDYILRGSFKEGIFINAEIETSEWSAIIDKGNVVNYKNKRDSSYSGTFDKNGQTGNGTFTFEKKWTYEGTFNRGFFDGIGVITAVSGKKVSGTWEKGKRVN